MNEYFWIWRRFSKMIAFFFSIIHASFLLEFLSIIGKYCDQMELQELSRMEKFFSVRNFLETRSKRSFDLERNFAFEPVSFFQSEKSKLSLSLNRGEYCELMESLSSI